MRYKMDTKIKLYLTQKEVDALYLITGKIGGNPTESIRSFFNEIRKDFKPFVSKDVLNNYLNDYDYQN